jgi:hypothetical protein|tara:strand:+ start:15461 stop:15730 length:270 start_codon:yes stop_codon:yes gene_type:complete
MAKKIKKNKKTSKPNVFQQNTSGSSLIQNSDSNSDYTNENNTVTKVTKVTKSNINNFASDSLVPFELKKIGIITGALFIILIIITFFLG